MGSGKGQTRRAQTKFPAGEETLTDMAKWDEFTRSIGMEEVNLYEYYLEEKPDRQDDSAREKVVNELFTDAITVGAISLPIPYTPNDFELKVKRYNQSSSGLHITLKNQPNLETFHNNTIIGLRHDIGVGHAHVKVFFERVVRAINELVNAEQNNIATHRLPITTHPLS
jgi:hypothetical protein